MSVIALTNIYDGLKSYVPGEVIEGLTEDEERRLIKLNYAEPVQGNGVEPKKRGRK